MSHIFQRPPDLE